MIFLKLEADLLKCRQFSPLAKILIAYIRGLTSTGKSCWAKPETLADLFGCDQKVIVDKLFFLETQGIIMKRENGYVCTMALDLICELRPNSKFAREIDNASKILTDTFKISQ